VEWHSRGLIASNAVVLTMPIKSRTVLSSEETVCDPFSNRRRSFDVDLQPGQLKFTLMGRWPRLGFSANIFIYIGAPHPVGLA
jgi:hypothetical protein